MITGGYRDDLCTDDEAAAGHISFSRWPLLHRFLHRQCLVLQVVLGNGVPSWPQAALEERGRLVGLFLDRAPEGVVLPRPVAAHGRLADVDDDDVAAEVHHLAARDEGGVVAPRHLTWTKWRKEDIVRGHKSGERGRRGHYLWIIFARYILCTYVHNKWISVTKALVLMTDE